MEGTANISLKLDSCHRESFKAPSSSSLVLAGQADTGYRVAPEKPVQLLVLEDDKTDMKLIELYLSYAKDIYFTLIHATTLSQGRKYLQDYQFDAALLDYYLPDGKGIELVSELTPQLYMPVVVLSGYDTDRISQDMLNIGIYDFIPKMKMNPVLLEKVLKLAMMRSRQLRMNNEGHETIH